MLYEVITSILLAKSAENVEEGDLVITLGCGDVYKVAKQLAEKLKEN